MTPDQYQQLALRTERTPEIVFDRNMSRLFHGMVGICTEAGELQDMVKKHVIYGKPFDRLNIKEELGDILWYVALAADAYGFTLEEVMQRNIDKLQARYGDKFSSDAALNRDLEREKAALEGVRFLPPMGAILPDGWENS